MARPSRKMSYYISFDGVAHTFANESGDIHLGDFAKQDTSMGSIYRPSMRAAFRLARRLVRRYQHTMLVEQCATYRRHGSCSRWLLHVYEFRPEDLR